MEENQKLVKITDEVSIHLPVDINPAVEAKIVAMLRKDLEEPERVEAELRELMRLHEEGKLMTFEDLFVEMGIVHERL